MTVQMRTVEFQVPGVVDGFTPSPALSFDPRSPLYKAADPDGIVRFTAAEMLVLTGGDFGLFDPDFLLGGTFADRFTELLEVVTAGAAAIASIQIVDAEGLVEQQEIVLGPETNYYDRDLILVPQGSALRFLGYTATPAQPVVIRISVVSFTTIDDYADLRLVACCSGGATPLPPGSSDGPTYVYRPGGVAGENVYTDFPTLTAALALKAGPKWVEVDDSFVPIPLIPAGIWDVNGATFQSLVGSDQTLLRASPGARLTNIFRIQGTLQLQNFDPAAATIILAANDVFDMAEGASLASLAGAPVIDVPGAGTAILRMYASEIANVGLGPAVGVSGGAGSSLLIQLWEGSTVNNDTISSAVGSVVTAQMRSSAANFNRDQTPLLGGLVFNYFVAEQQAPVTVAGTTLPVLGYVNATASPVTLPLAILSDGPIVVRNTLATTLTIAAGVGNTIDGAATKVVPPGAVVTFKSNGLLAWITEDKSFVNFDALGDAVSHVDDLTNFGSLTQRWRRVVKRMDVANNADDGPGFAHALTLPADAVGAVWARSFGTLGGGTAEAESSVASALTWFGANLHQYSDAGVARVETGGRGFVLANAYSIGADDDAEVFNDGLGTFLGGYALLYNPDSGASARVRMAAPAYGAFCWGYAASDSRSGEVYVNGNARGSATFGRAINGGFIQNYATGTLMHGHCNGSATPAIGTIRAEGPGSFVGGHSVAVAANPGMIRSRSTAFGAIVHGSAFGGTIEAYLDGAVAVGFADATRAIRANGYGAVAIGAADGADIIATGENAMQFGEGSNAVAQSFRIGAAGLHFKMTAGAFGVLADGQFWVSGGNVYCRTGGISKNLTNIV